MAFQERRRAERFRVNLNTNWESSSGRRRGIISDISTSGCFVLAAPEVKVKEQVKVGIQLPGGKDITLTGETVYAVEEMGFALRFTDLGEREQHFLTRLISSARRNLAQ